MKKKEKHQDSDYLGISKDGKDQRYGLNLTYRSLASILKYDMLIPERSPEARKKPKKGYYKNSSDLVKRIKEHVVPGFSGEFKTIECSIMDIADDIAYSTYDIEDALKAGFVTPLEIISSKSDIIDLVYKALENSIPKNEIVDILYWAFGGFIEGDPRRTITKSKATEFILQSFNASRNIAQDGYLRNSFTSYLVSFFIANTELVPNSTYPMLSTLQFKPDVYKIVEVLKKYAFVTIISSPKLRIAEYRGEDIVKKIFERIKESTLDPSRSLLPDDYRSLYEKIEDDEKDRMICDFIAGMTDRYALEFYGRLYSDHPQTIFKPL